MELVQVKCWKFKAGDPVPSCRINGAEVAVLVGKDGLIVYPWHYNGVESYTDVENVIDVAADQKIAVDPFSDGSTDYFYDKPLLLFEFEFFGESNSEEESGGAEWNIRNGGVGDWFAEEAGDLVKTAERLFGEQKIKLYPDLDFCRWIIGLSFSSSFDYYGEYDCTTEYLGYIDLDTIKTV